MNDAAVVKLLLEYGAQPDLEDADGQTPLSRTRDPVVVQLLSGNPYGSRSR
jgi:ankyrin repeat protein